MRPASTGGGTLHVRSSGGAEGSAHQVPDPERALELPRHARGAHVKHARLPHGTLSARTAERGRESHELCARAERELERRRAVRAVRRPEVFCAALRLVDSRDVSI